MMRSAVVGVLVLALSGCSCSRVPPEGPSAKATCSPGCAPGNECQEGLCVPTLPALELGSALLVDAHVGQAYQHRFAASGGLAPYQFAVAGGELPGGLSLDGVGALAGTPTDPGSVEFVLQVSDASSPPLTASRSFTLRVVPAPLTFGAALPDAQIGVEYAAAITLSGGTRPHAFALVEGARLPDGLAMDPSGAIAGTPTTVGTARFQVQAVDSSAPPLALVGTQVIRVRTATGHLPLEFATETLPQGQTGQSYSVPLEVTGGEPPYAIALAEGSHLPEGLLLTAEGALSGVPAVTGSFAFEVEVRDAAPSSQQAIRLFELQIVPGPLGIGPVALNDGLLGAPYLQRLAGVGGAPPYTFSVASGALPAGLALAGDGTLSGVPAEHGVFAFAASVVDGDLVPANATREYSLRIAPAPLTLGADLPEAQVGLAYVAAVPVGGGVAPYQLRLLEGTLPPGLGLDGNGALAGTATVAATYRFSLEVLDAGSPQSRAAGAFALVVRTGDGELPLEINTTSLADGAIGQPYSARLAVTGGTEPYLFSLEAGTALPEGLQLTPEGEIVGTPARAGTYELVVQVDDSGTQLASRSYTLRIVPAGGALPLAFDALALPDAWVGQAYVAQLSASGGASPYRFGLTAESQVPPGLYVDAAGAVRGTPFATGTFRFTAAVWDASDPYQAATRVMTLTVRSDVAGGQLVVTSLTLRKPKVGKAYSTRLTASGGSGSYLWQVMFGSLPPGIVIDSRGVVSGTTEVQGSFPLTVEVWDELEPGLRAQATLLLRSMATGAAGMRFQMSAYAQGRVQAAYLQSVKLISAIPAVAFTLAGAPAGLGLDSDGSATAWLSGTPQVAGRFATIVTAQETRLNGDVAVRHDPLTILPDPAGLLLSTSMLPQGKVGLDYAMQLGASGGSGSYAFAAVDGTALPANLVLEPNGRIGGVPSAAGSTAVVIEVSDLVSGRTAKTQFLIEVAP